MILLNTYKTGNLILDSVQMEVSDINKLIVCKNNVIKELKNPTLFIAPENTYLYTILKGYGKVISLLHNNTVIAFASFVFPKDGNHNLGKYLDFTHSQLKQVAQFENGLVETNYRGHGLLRILLNEHLNILNPQYNFLLSTVSPYNIPSLKTGFKLGQVIKKRVLYHGYDRFILFRDFNYSISFKNSGILICKTFKELDFYLKQNYVARYDFDNKCYILSKFKGDINETF